MSPAPPKDFLDGAPYRGRIQNLSGDRLSDETVEQWILADLRRARADAYATYNLRRDIADAGIFGPAGLNGTSETIDRERARGTQRIEYQGHSEVVSAAVVYLSEGERRTDVRAGHTEYVIVLVSRATGVKRARVLRDGGREPFGRQREKGELTWQLDTGHFVAHPVLGPLWYQEKGWACIPNDGSPNGAICGKVPAPKIPGALRAAQ